MAEQSKMVNKHTNYIKTHSQSQSLPNLPPHHLLILLKVEAFLRHVQKLRILPWSQGATAKGCLQLKGWCSSTLIQADQCHSTVF